jgi:hypothetical protein
VEWTSALEGVLSSSPLAIVLGFAVMQLWKSNQAKDAEIARLNQARVADLLMVSKLDD